MNLVKKRKVPVNPMKIVENMNPIKIVEHSIIKPTEHVNPIKIVEHLTEHLINPIKNI